ncbi:hypothetical protein IGI04_014938 [Brassica rapa subsp. trilocularis]|uniref:Uncharacterized protein n=1 Tax=Brassica rapa subsp. trilocularis TaxID=1813537 RepID=A0ABQ7MR42_BRACM|nr:hypothetical protein IGI04_014938 [Brassica rapa subsp. trilocularis]
MSKLEENDHVVTREYKYPTKLRSLRLTLEAKKKWGSWMMYLKDSLVLVLSIPRFHSNNII